MRRLLLFFTFWVAILYSFDCEAKQFFHSIKEEDTVKTLQKNVCRKAINKSVGSLLDKIDFKYSYVHFVEMKPYYLTFVSFKYGKDLWLDIYIENYKHIKQVLSEDEYKNREKFWNEQELVKEKVLKIRVRKNGEVIKEFPKKPTLPIW